MERDWKPVRKGDMYCSPACGCRCTHAAFVAATNAADGLCKRLDDGWKPCVWENMGWYWSVEKGAAALHYHDRSPKSYTLYLDCDPQIVEQAATIEEVFEQARNRARAIISSVHAVVGGLQIDY